MESPSNFGYRGLGLYEAIDALMAHDLGATDSGVKDASLKQAVKDYLHDSTEFTSRKVLDGFARRLLDKGHGLSGVLEFVEWLRTEMGIDI
jgi:hypothetical protein